MTTRQVGKPAVSFDLPDTQGARHRLEDYRGRFLLMVFHRHLS
jgi:peroxiredoxin